MVTAKLLTTPPKSVYLCSIVLSELIFGAVRSGPLHEALNRAKIAKLQSLFPTLPFDEAAAEEYGKLRAYLWTTGQMIGANDMLIAAIALSKSVTLVTHNTTEFKRVPGLVLEDWQ
jgi:tRNA(fMet)-specific endonuclease VapC